MFTEKSQEESRMPCRQIKPGLPGSTTSPYVTTGKI